jgi:hypothetical protein
MHPLTPFSVAQTLKLQSLAPRAVGGLVGPARVSDGPSSVTTNFYIADAVQGLFFNLVSEIVKAFPGGGYISGIPGGLGQTTIPGLGR